MKPIKKYTTLTLALFAGFLTLPAMAHAESGGAIASIDKTFSYVGVSQVVKAPFKTLKFMSDKIAEEEEAVKPVQAMDVKSMKQPVHEELSYLGQGPVGYDRAGGVNTD